MLVFKSWLYSFFHRLVLLPSYTYLGLYFSAFLFLSSLLPLPPPSLLPLPPPSLVFNIIARHYRADGVCCTHCIEEFRDITTLTIGQDWYRIGKQLLLCMVDLVTYCGQLVFDDMIDITHLSLSLSVSLSLFVSVIVCLSVSVSLPLSLCLCLSVSLCLCLCLSLSLCVWYWL